MRWLFLIALLAGCKKAPPRTAFPTPLPELQAPELGALPEPTPDAAPVPAAMKPGQRPPYVDATCRATHRATVVPEDLVLDLSRDGELAEFWERRAREERFGRDADRRYCDTVIAPLEEDRQTLDDDNRALRWTTVAGFIGGVFLGAIAVGVGNGSVP